MTKFATRAKVDATPDMFGEEYKFTKINLDDFVAWVDANKLPSVCPHDGIILAYLDATRLDNHWYVTPSRIYYWSRESYPEDFYEVLTEPRTVVSEKGWPCPKGQTKETTYPVGSRIFRDYAKLHTTYFSETQKWVKKIEDLMSVYGTSVDFDTYRAIIKTATGK